MVNPIYRPTYHISYEFSKIYLPAIAGHVPDDMVKCVATFLNICYIIQLNTISLDIINNQLTNTLDQYNQYHHIFVTMGICEHFNLPHSHAQSHIIQAIQLFGSPNGLCSSITESKHIEAVQSARYKALKQMLVIHAWTEKMHAVGAAFAMCCMLVGLSLEYARRMKDGKAPVPLDEIEDEDVDEQGAAEGPKVMSSICLVKRQSAYAY